jgi:hypothetical protein
MDTASRRPPSRRGAQHPDRDAQLEYINAKAQDRVGRNIPVISVDTKKQELVGDFKNSGREWQPEDEPELVDVHDFPGDAVGKAIPYGVFDRASNDGLVSVGKKVSAAELKGLTIEPDDFHGDWNYVIRPRPKVR